MKTPILLPSDIQRQPRMPLDERPLDERLTDERPIDERPIDQRSLGQRLADDDDLDEPSKRFDERPRNQRSTLRADETRDDIDTPSSYLPETSSERAGERWRQIQAEFVDDPRTSVHSAHQLVGELMQTIADGFARERANLEGQWSKGTEVSTEDLRVCLQRYRDFFNRLLPAIDRANGA
jgi:hypothetical protein